jgi:hypothetical protein
MPLNLEGSGRIRGLTDPALDSDAARKKFVEDKVAEGAEITGSLDNLDDVSTAEANDGDVLTYFDGEDAYWGPSPIDPPPSALNDLSDVYAQSPSEGDTVTYVDEVAGVAASGSYGQDDLIFTAKETGTALNGVTIYATDANAQIFFDQQSNSWFVGTPQQQGSFEDFANYVNTQTQTELPFTAVGTAFTFTDGSAELSGGVDEVAGGWYSTQLSTTEVAEGANLYFTDQRADARIAAADTDDLSEGQTNLYYTDNRALGVAVDKTGDTMTGILTAPNYNVGVTANFSAESIFIDFSSGDGLIDAESDPATGGVAFSGSNYTPGGIKTIRIKNKRDNSSALNLIFPNEWVFVGEKPTELDYDKVAILTLTSFRDEAAGVVAGWIAEE